MGAAQSQFQLATNNWQLWTVNAERLILSLAPGQSHVWESPLRAGSANYPLVP
jgi:hypothetical protein